MVVLLAGGTGGAKLARGLQHEIGGELTVIANTGDDVEIYNAYVSPDPDLVTFWLAGRIDERGWGLAGDTFLAWAGHPLTSEGIAAHYEGLIDGLVADERADSVPTLVTDVEMGDDDARRRVARETLAFAAALTPG